MARGILGLFFEYSKEEEEKILSESYESMVWTGIELLALNRDPSKFEDWIEYVGGLEYLNEAFAKGKGAICVATHMANWEFANIWMGKQGEAASIVRESDSSFQKELIAELRSIGNVKLIDKKEPMTRALSYLKKNGYGIVADQHAGEEGIRFLFWLRNRECCSPAVFAYLTGATLLPFTFRVSRSKLEYFYSPIIWEKGTNRDSTIKEITTLVNKAIEKQILLAPGQWLWQHRRFREITGD